MAVKIRLTRLGSKKNAHYRVVVIDSHSPRDGKSIETIGRYVPQADPSVVEIDTERARAWLAKGAQPSDSVRTLMARHLTAPAAPAAATATEPAH